MSYKVFPRRVEEGELEYMFRCPGCMTQHSVRVEGSPSWVFNGNFKYPTFTPDVTYGYEPKVCHFQITLGHIKFYDDCWHKLAGMTVNLPVWDGET